jgi:osmoprotectant transport system ATP-binding protein
MEMVGLDPGLYLDRYPSSLSGGQQQRIGVARAFACDPDIILMDEPFSALDPITRLQLQDELVKLQARLRKTIVFVTHDMDEAVKIANRICIINKGSIVQYDTEEAIMKNPANAYVAEFIGKNRIWSSPEFIRAKDIMIQTPVCTSQHATVLHCAVKMRAQKVDSLLITNKKGNLLGIITAKMTHLPLSAWIPVSKIMRRKFETVSPDQNILEILKIVNGSGLSTIPVIDEADLLRGLITKSSLLTTLSQQYLDTPEMF